MSGIFELGWQSTLLLGTAWLLAAALRRSSAASRHAVWTAALLSLPALPLLTQWTPRMAQVPGFAIPAAPAEAPAASRPAAVESAPAAPRPWGKWIWAAGALAVAARTAAGLLRVMLLSRRAAPAPAAAAGLAAEIDLPGRVALRAVAGLRMPMTWGWRRPEILLPDSAAGWPVQKLRVVLLHEWMHIERADFLTQLLARAVCAIYWFHPLAWLAMSRLRRERECACDDGVLRKGAAPADYAQHLLDLARSLGRAPAAAAAMAQPSHLEERVAAILRPDVDRRPVAQRGAWAAALAALILVAALSTVRAAQSGMGRLSGVVQDASGARVPKTAVAVESQTGSRQREMAWTNEAGEFAFAALPAGVYTLTARRGGFAIFERKDVAVRAGAEERIEATLALGRVSETQEVVAKAPRPAAAANLRGTPQRIRVGGNVQATRLLSMVKAVYPEPARLAGIEGAVLIEAVIGLDGGLIGAHSVNANIDTALAAAALEAVKQWRYQPTLLNGQPVEIVTTITVNFRLEP